MSSRPDVHRFEILLVEDNPADVYLFSRSLECADLDCSLTVIEDGLEALTFARREGKYVTGPSPHLAVLDLNLPQFGGIDILEVLRNSEQFKTMPVIILTSSADPRERTRAQELGIEQFITKPTDLEAFLQIGHIVKTVLLNTKIRLQA